jgi:hypothetical protein
MKKYYLACLFVATLIFTRCSTDVDLIAPYKETTVVYGLLAPTDSVQYIRVAKAYLGEGNALTMAAVNDSIYYPDSVINVVLQRWDNNVLVDSTILVRDESIIKDPGIFSSQPNILYRTVKDPVNHSDSIYKSSIYKLRIYNKLTHNEVTSSTPVVEDIGIIIPSSNLNVTVSMSSPLPYTVKWNSALNGKIYNLVIRFRYEEKEIAPPNNVTNKSADWTFANKELNNPLVKEVMEISYMGEDFYKNLALKILPASGIERKFLGLDFIFTIGAEEFYTYYLVNQPSLTINQSIPNFTNIKNGLGIFSSRNITTLRNKQLDISSLDSLRNGQYTYNLSFQ